MVGWMDDEALHRTLTTGRSTFWSRSRQEYWVKGDTSGHVQHVRSVALDCDGDSVLVRVDQVGAACHTGDRTCFDAGALARHRRAAVTAAPRRSRPTAPPPTARSPPTWTRSGSWPARTGSSRSYAACSPTARPPSGSTASWPKTLPARFCSNRPSTAGPGRGTPSSAHTAAATLTERAGHAHWLGNPPVGHARRRGPARGAAYDGGRAAHRPAARSSPAHRRPGGLPRL